MKLENEVVKKEIARAIAGGRSQTKLAKVLGVSQSTISRLVNREEMEVLIEAERLKQVESIVSLIQNMEKIPPKDKKQRGQALEASFKLLKSLGIFNPR